MLKRLTIGKKLALITIALSFVLVALSSVMLFELKGTMIEGRKVKLRGLVESAVNVINLYAQQAADGTLSEEAAKKAAVEALGGMTFDGKNYFFVFDNDGLLVWHPTRQEQIGQNMLKLEDPQARGNYELFHRATNGNAFLEGYSESLGRRPGSKVNDAMKLYLSAKDPRWNWIVSTGVFIDDIESLFWQRAALFMGLAGAGLALGLGLSYFIGRSITGPLTRTVTALEELGEGRSETVVETDNSKTEIGRLTRAFNHFREKMKETEQLRAQQVVAEKKSQEERRSALLGFADEFERSVAGAVAALAEEVSKVSKASNAMSDSAKASANGTQQVNAAAESTASNVQTVASAAQELTSSIEEIRRQVMSVQQVVEKTKTRSSETQSQVSALADSVEKIGSVVELINSIAEQTNLLALNATIEAARAGDAGKGFAVVAGEVKALATQTTSATEDIRQQIDVLNLTTGHSVEGMKDVASVVSDLLETTSAIAAAIEQQNAATGEISRNTDITARETQSITKAISDVTASVSATEATARSVSETSAIMQDRAETVSREVQAFLQRIRAA
ncbi:methyl-accepting chemotaxis protein [Pelagibius sp. 7325]|uniref:methyl-accepting chemotaxis protein n=1 Tax=Pelagibius sp. 7325 TaxID=3131994 RepID=UPI0030EC18DA